MSTLNACQAYFDAWNNRDAAAITASLNADATYSDPVAGEIPAAAVAGYATALWEAFPDLAFDVTGLAQTGEDTAAAEWTMRGTNSGPFRGLPPTGKTVTVPGADFIAVAGDKVKTVRGYFDGTATPTQLGLQVIVQPTAIGPFAFGNSASVRSGRLDRPGAISVTKLEARDDADAEAVRQLSRQIATDMLGMDGFIGFVGATVGSAMMTISAWDTPEQVDQINKNPTHKDAARKFFGPELAVEGWTGVFVPHHINALLLRCDSCGKMLRLTDGQTACGCGAQLRPAKPYW